MPSSVIDHFSYEASPGNLKIKFVSGLIYQYEHVPIKVYHMLKAAGSKGSYFNHYIKGKFNYQQIDT